MLQAICLQLHGTNDKPTQYIIWHLICLRSFILYLSCMYPYVFANAPSNLVHHTPTIIAKKILACCTPPKQSMYNFLPSSTAWNSLLPSRTQKHYSFFAGVPATQVHFLYVTCSGTSCKSSVDSTALHFGKSLLHVVLLVML